jgi:hypothetical protein
LTPAEHTKGTGVYELGQQVTIKADEKIDVIPFIYSKKFTQWSDGSKEPARLIILQHDTVLQAEYKNDYSLIILPIVLILTVVILKKVITSYMERKYEEMLSEI